MNQPIKRRHFVASTTLGPIALQSMLVKAGITADMGDLPLPKSKIKIGKVYLGRSTPGWPMARVDLEAERNRFEGEFEKLQPQLSDIEFVGNQVVTFKEQLEQTMAQFDKQVDGILVIHLSLGAGPYLKELLKLGVPVVFFSAPYSGHEWHIIAPLQKTGAKIEAIPSSDMQDLVTAIEPLRAIGRMKESKILFLAQNAKVDDTYIHAAKNKFGTVIKRIGLDQLTANYHDADSNAVQSDANRWIKETEKIVEPTQKEIVDSSRMYLALLELLKEEQAQAITIECLGMGLMEKNMAYPCLGFSRLNGLGLGGVCEADIKSTMTQMIFQYMTGKTGFVTDPVIDLSNNTVIHAHCMSAIKMDGVDGEQSPYLIRNHLEDAKGVSLQVKMRLNQPISLARLIGMNNMLFSTGTIIENPDVDRGCRTKVKTQVKNAKHLLENWSCGLHRVMIYGDHTDNIKRFCRFKEIRLVMEEEENTYDIPELEWETYIHA